jgi:hypothetical protein
VTLSGSEDRCSACEDKLAYVRGLCGSCYARFMRTGTVEKKQGGTPWEIAWRNIRIDDETGCWIWMGTAFSNGYGAITVNRKALKAHRFIYETIGRRTIPPGLVIDHLCRVLLCCNPDHLEPVTQKENINRGLVPGLSCSHDRTLAYQTEERSSNNGRYYLINRCRACNSERSRRNYLRRKAVADGLR